MTFEQLIDKMCNDALERGWDDAEREWEWVREVLFPKVAANRKSTDRPLTTQDKGV